jgi:3-deoxy-manno-octulosonate cytidylyltransferase (CMP-KDO synthetase)
MMSSRPLSSPADQVLVLIPARLNSTRLPSKPLVDLGGKPLIIRVLEQVSLCTAVDQCRVVTDHPPLITLVEQAGFKGILIDRPCDSGTQRVVYGAQELIKQGWQGRYFINVQGDEPFIKADALTDLIMSLKQGAQVATLVTPLAESDRLNPHRVKVALDCHQKALYFSRSPIGFHLHLGVYGFQKETLHLGLLPRSPLSIQEDLEQLTWLEAGYQIQTVETKQAFHSIDTYEDLEYARHLITLKNLKT